MKKVELELNIHSYEDVQKWAIETLENDPSNEFALDICFLSTPEEVLEYSRCIPKNYLMILYVCSYVVRDSIQRGDRIDIKEIGWFDLSKIIKEIFYSGGSISISKTITEYQDEYSTFCYKDLDYYYMICDKRYGYIFNFSTENEEKGFSLFNKNDLGTQKNYTFQPYDDEYNSQYVHQDLELAIKIFKEIYEDGYISTDSKKLFTNE